jgi:hypothetical protein
MLLGGNDFGACEGTDLLNSILVLFEILFLCLNYETEWQQCIIIHCQIFFFFAEVNGFLLG